MTKNRIIIVGLGIAGFFAAKYSLLTNKNAEVLIIEKRDYDMFSPCGLPFALEGGVKFDSLKKSLPEMGNLTRLLAHEALSIDINSKELKTKNLTTNEIKYLPYDKLIIATGSKPVKFLFPEKFFGKVVHTVSNIEDTKLLCKSLSGIKSALVVGAGAIGLEVAAALRKYCREIFVVEKENRLLPNNLDEDMSRVAEEKLKHMGIKFIFGEKIKKISEDKKISCVEVGNEKIQADIIVLCAGTAPNIKLAEDAGIKIGITGGIKINEKAETSVENVYACGDCAETISFITKKPVISRLASIAYKQGEIAGINASGGKAEYNGALGTFVTVLGDLEIASVGFNSENAIFQGYKIITSKTKSKTKPEYMPESDEILMKIIADEKTGKVLGAQSIGKGAFWRINLAAVAIQNNIHINDLKNVEIAYSPAVCEVYDAFSMAAEFLARRLAR